MFQSFERHTRPENGAPRIAALRAEMTRRGLDGVLVPRTDAWQGEYVAPCDERLAWLTGFSGSAGIAAILADRAALFVDGRYRLQAGEEVDAALIDVHKYEDGALPAWLAAALTGGGRVAFDPWLHGFGEIDRLLGKLRPAGITLTETANLVDAVWTDRPARPAAPVFVHPTERAGREHDAKRADLAAELAGAGQRAAVLTAPESIAWLLNIRGGDIAHTPVAQGFAILHDDARVDLFMAPSKLDEAARAHLGAEVTIRPEAEFEAALAALTGPVRVDRQRAPFRVTRCLGDAGVERAFGADPCLAPRATKTDAEIAGAKEAHLIDAAAMAEFLSGLEATAPGGLTEIDVVTRLEACRRETGQLREIAFDTIAGSGPHGAIVHYRVTRESNRALRDGDLLLIDSGGQYEAGTTDITRTVPVGKVDPALAEIFTRVLRGLIAMSSARWPAGLAGRDLDALARAPLWAAGEDYDHGTGHGVGSYLSVHEGPQRLSRKAEAVLEPGMILSIEPGCYRPGEFGIRIENLAVIEASDPGADARAMRRFRTLTRVPIDRRLILIDRLTGAERAWIDGYHDAVRAALTPRLGPEAAAWLERATRPL